MKTPLSPSLVGTLLLCAAAAPAAPLVTFDLKDANRDTGWRIRYDPDQVSGPEFFGTATGRFQGLLTWNKRFKDGGPIEVGFEQLNNNDDNFGLRITLNEAIANQSGFDWPAFKMDLMDTHAFGDLNKDGDDPAQPNWNTSVSSVHPGYSHFHGDIGRLQSGTVFMPPFTAQDPSILDGEASLLLGGGTFANGQGSLWGGFGIHQIEETGQKRDFKLIQRPVPEASTLGGGVGVVMLALTAMGRHHRQRKIFQQP